MSTVFWHSRFMQQANWTKNTRDYLFNKANYSNETNILELGCGTGAVTSSIPDANIFGLDINLDYLQFANSHDNTTNFIHADAFNCPFSDNFFEITFFHFFLLWINDPLLILREIVRITKPGGSIIACAEPDYSGRLDYPDNLRRIGQLQTQSLINQGSNPFIGKELPHLFSQLDVTISEIGVINGLWNYPLSPQYFDLEWKVIEQDLVEMISPEEITKYKESEIDAINDNSYVRYIPTFYLLAIKK